MCTCDQTNPVTEEYHTAFSDFERSTPEEWRTSTRYHEEDTAPEYTPPPSRRTPRQDFPRAIPRIPMRNTRGIDLTAGVAVVPRRIDFDAVSDVEDFEDEDLGELARETLERLRSAAQYPTYVPESTVAPGTYKVRRTRATQHPTEYQRQYAPRMTRVTPCGKCLRM